MKDVLRCAAVFSLLSLVAPVDVPAAIPPRAAVFVAPGGSDTNPGTASEPVKTIQQAQKLVRKLLAAGRKEDVLVSIGDGTYRISQPLVFTHEDTGGKEQTVTYAGADAAKVVISGGRPITGWKKEGHLFKVQLPLGREGKSYFRELFVGGRRAVRARSPNDGYFRVTKAGPDNRTSFHVAPDDLGALAGNEDAEVVFMHDWSTSRVRIKSVDKAALAVHFTAPIGCGASHYSISHFEPHPRYYVENGANLLDAPGEWYFDRKTGVLSYWPREGESAESLDAVAPLVEALVRVGGDAEKNRPAGGLHFQGLTFSHCAWQIPERGYAAGQAGFCEDRDRRPDRPPRVPIPAAVTFDVAEDCVVRNCVFRHLGGSGVYFRQMCHRNRLVDNRIEDVAANGVMIGETFTRPLPEGDSREGAPPDLVSRGNVVTSNVVEHCGSLYYGSVGIWVGIGAETTIAENEIRHLPYTGVSLGWSWNTRPTGCTANVVRDNHIHHVLEALSDGGGIYTLGRQPGSVLRGNLIHDVKVNAGRAESNGIFMDEGSSLILVEGQTIYNTAKSPIRFHKAEGNTIRKNRLVVRPGTPAFRYNATRPESMTYEDNTVIEAERWQPPEDANR